MENLVAYDESGDQEKDERVDDHLEKALESCENEQTKYHLREALGLFRID